MKKSVKDFLKSVGMTEEEKEIFAKIKSREIWNIGDNVTNKEICSYLEGAYKATPSPETVYLSIMDIGFIFFHKIIEKVEKIFSKSDREDKLFKLIDYYNKRLNKIFESNEQFDIPQDSFIFMILQECLLFRNPLVGTHLYQLIYSKFKTKIKIFESHQEK